MRRALAIADGQLEDDRRASQLVYEYSRPRPGVARLFSPHLRLESLQYLAIPPARPFPTPVRDRAAFCGFLATSGSPVTARVRDDCSRPATSSRAADCCSARRCNGWTKTASPVSMASPLNVTTDTERARKVTGAGDTRGVGLRLAIADEANRASSRLTSSVAGGFRVSALPRVLVRPELQVYAADDRADWVCGDGRMTNIRRACGGGRMEHWRPGAEMMGAVSTP